MVRCRVTGPVRTWPRPGASAIAARAAALGSAAPRNQERRSTLTPQRSQHQLSQPTWGPGSAGARWAGSGVVEQQERLASPGHARPSVCWRRSPALEDSCCSGSTLPHSPVAPCRPRPPASWRGWRGRRRHALWLPPPPPPTSACPLAAARPDWVAAAAWRHRDRAGGAWLPSAPRQPQCLVSPRRRPTSWCGGG